MKKLLYLLLATSVSLLYSCNFSVGTNKDLRWGLHHSYNGFSVDEVLLVSGDNAVMSTNEVPLNSEVAIVVQGLDNYSLKDEKAFPGLMLLVTDKNGRDVVDEADLFAESEGYSAADAAIIRGTVTVGDPMKVGETYHVKMKVWDKNKVDNELTAEVDIVVI